MAETYHLLVERPAPELLSIVIPAFDEEEVIPHLRSRLEALVLELPCKVEVVIVNDGSSDRSLDLLLAWAREDSRTKILSLARNFGHQAAATAGLDHASGEAVVLMDADLQDPPEVILPMLEQYCHGYDVVYGRRSSRRGESWLKRSTAKLFYRAMKMLVIERLPADVGDFRLISRDCLEAVRHMPETHRFLRGMVSWVGYPQTSVDFVRQPRIAGSSKYSYRKMLSFAWTAAVSFSGRPLRISFLFSLAATAAAVLLGSYAFFRALLGFYVVHGWASLMVATCLIGAAVLTSIGLLGEYISRIYEESKRRPLYIAARKVNFEDEIREKPGEL